MIVKHGLDVSKYQCQFYDGKSVGTICGLGSRGYDLALEYALTS